MRPAVAVALLLGGLVPACPLLAQSSPAWLASTLYDDLGREDRVPLPWSPVGAEGRGLRAWGRSYAWTDRSLLPASIRSGGQELLAGPVVLRLTRGGRGRLVPLADFRVTSRSRSRVCFRAGGAAAGVTFSLTGWLEYDGFLWLELSAAAPARTSVDSLRVQAPLRADQATLYQAFDRRLAGFVGDRPVRFSWRPDPRSSVLDFYHWFGTEDRGLGFTYATLEHWRPRSEEAFACLSPGPRRHTYTLNLLERPGAISGLHWCFGLQATPIKPLPPDYHSMLAGTLYGEPWRAVQQLRGNVDLTLVWPLDTGIMKGLNDPYGLDAGRMAEAVRSAHAAGLPITTIAACPQKVSPQVPELATCREDWRVEPESVLEWDKQPQVQNCGKSESLRRWLFYGWAVENVRRFHTDGIYFDGWQAGTMGCCNARHGCGWTEAQGRRQLTVPVLEGREFNQRLLLFLQREVACEGPGCRGRGTPAPGESAFPRCHYWIHSWEFVPPVMGFATEWLTGEFAGWPLQGPSMLTPEGSYGKCLGLGLFRARCLSTNWGVPNLFDTLMWEAEKDCPTDRQTLQAYAWLLPHGVSPAMVHYMNHKTVVQLTRVLEQFGTRRSRFTPGWRPNPYWQVLEPRCPEVMVATWDHAPAPGVLTVVSNLQVECAATVRLRWLGGTPPGVTDARSGAILPLQGQTLEVPLQPESFVLLRVGER